MGSLKYQKRSGTDLKERPMKKEILEGNKLIAEFDGRINELCHHNNTSSPYDYDKSWDWLMPVVEKIETMGFNVRIEGISCSISRLCEDETIAGFVCGDRSKKLEIIHSTLVKFIESYNENKNL